VRVIVDFDLCMSNGLCEEIAPKVFRLGDDGSLEILNERPGDELAAAVREAVAACPTQAISVE
jgi:ferredoxin